jgi:hypothetical protein
VGAKKSDLCADWDTYNNQYMRSQSPGPYPMAGEKHYFSAPPFNDYSPDMLLSPPLTPQSHNYVSPVEYYPPTPPLNYHPSYIEHNSPYHSYPTPPQEYSPAYRPFNSTEHFGYDGNYWERSTMKWKNTLEEQYVDEYCDGYPYSPYVDSQIEKYNLN